MGERGCAGRLGEWQAPSGPPLWVLWAFCAPSQGRPWLLSGRVFLCLALTMSTPRPLRINQTAGQSNSKGAFVCCEFYELESNSQLLDWIGLSNSQLTIYIVADGSSRSQGG